MFLGSCLPLQERKNQMKATPRLGLESTPMNDALDAMGHRETDRILKLLNETLFEGLSWETVADGPLWSSGVALERLDSLFIQIATLRKALGFVPELACDKCLHDVPHFQCHLSW